MKLLVAIILVVLLGYTAYLFNNEIPWWGFAIGAFITGWIVPLKAWLSWLAGFIGMLVCWGILAWYANSENHGLMAAHMAEIFGLKSTSGIMVLITALLGAIVGGFACLTGTFVRKRPVVQE